MAPKGTRKLNKSQNITFLTLSVDADETERRITRFRRAARIAQLTGTHEAARAVRPGCFRAVWAGGGCAELTAGSERAFARRNGAVARTGGVDLGQRLAQQEQNEDLTSMLLNLLLSSPTLRQNKLECLSLPSTCSLV